MNIKSVERYYATKLRIEADLRQKLDDKRWIIVIHIYFMGGLIYSQEFIISESQIAQGDPAEVWIKSLQSMMLWEDIKLRFMEVSRNDDDET